MAKRRRLEFDPEKVTDTAVSDASPVPVTGFQAPPPISKVVAESATRAALEELSEVMARARAEGRLILSLPLAAIEASHLVRDRIGLDEEELQGLIGSIRHYGQRAPIEVTELGDGRYGLISGWRRLTALRRLAEETGEERFTRALALVRRPENAAEAYVAMVEENEIRLGLSYYERARIAMRAVEQGVFPALRPALQQLFANASRARRSKIGAFTTLCQYLDQDLRYPEAIPERLGLALAKRLELADSAKLETFLADLRSWPAADAEEELARLAAFAAADLPVENAPVTEEAKAPSPAVSEVKAKPAVAAKPAVIRPRAKEISPGLFLERGADQRLTISGPGVTDELSAALEAWLRAKG